MVALPVALFLIAAGWQAVLAGHAWWTVTESARVAARATYIASRGGAISNEVRNAADQAAERVLPGSMDTGRITTIGQDGHVTVSAPVPVIGPLSKVVGKSNAPRVTAKSRLRR